MPKTIPTYVESYRNGHSIYMHETEDGYEWTLFDDSMEPGTIDQNRPIYVDDDGRFSIPVDIDKRTPAPPAEAFWIATRLRMDIRVWADENEFETYQTRFGS